MEAKKKFHLQSKPIKYYQHTQHLNKEMQQFKLVYHQTFYQCVT